MMSVMLIGEDIKLMRARYDEALEMQGIPCKYQFPNIATTNEQGEPLVDSYSDMIETHIFFEGTPKVKTFKRLGWVVEMIKIYLSYYIVVLIYQIYRKIAYFIFQDSTQVCLIEYSELQN